MQFWSSVMHTELISDVMNEVWEGLTRVLSALCITLMRDIRAHQGELVLNLSEGEGVVAIQRCSQ